MTQPSTETDTRATAPLRLHFAAISDVGRVRKDNQDSGYVGPWLLAVCDGVGGRLRLELRFTWLGGSRILERVERRPADLLTYRPALGAADAPVLLWRAARWSASGS